MLHLSSRFVIKLLELFEDKDTDFESPSVTLVQINSTLSHLMVAGNTLKLAAFPASLTCLMSGRDQSNDE